MMRLVIDGFFDWLILFFVILAGSMIGQDIVRRWRDR